MADNTHSDDARVDTPRTDQARPQENGSRLDAVAAQGPIPGVAAEDAAAQRGEDHSADNEPSQSGRGLLNRFLPDN